jgi:hypothetical protein
MKPADRRGAMCEWALALGLSLRTTQQRFGARDGRPRDASAPPVPETPASGAAEVVDLTAAVRASGETREVLEPAASATAFAGPRAGTQRPTARREPYHA